MLLKPSKIDIDDKTSARELLHRDDAKEVFASTLSIISVFTYQGIMFYCQMVLSNEIIVKDPVTNVITFKPIEGNQMIWLVIVTACFYSYMLSNMTYIMIRQCQSACCTSLPTTDRNKVLTDYIVYAQTNLTWFALSFVLCTMPFVCLLLVNVTYEDTTHQQSFLPIMYTMWAMHVFNMFVHTFLYSPKKKRSNNLSPDSDDDFF